MKIFFEQNKTFITLLFIACICLYGCGSKSSDKGEQVVEKEEVPRILQVADLRERVNNEASLTEEFKALVNKQLDGKAKPTFDAIEWVQLAGTYAGNVGYEKAIPSFKFGTKLFPTVTHSHYYLGDAYVEIADTTNAITCFNKAYEVDNRNNNAKDIVSWLNNPQLATEHNKICPPCYCNQHKYKFKDASICIVCSMPLVVVDTEEGAPED